MITVGPCAEDYATIQEAMDASFEGDEIIVSPGTYTENIDFKGKNIILRSTAPTNESVRDSTIIDGNSTGTVVTFSGDELSSCILSGFTITNGDDSDGGGIHGGGRYGKICRATIEFNNISTNTISGHGGGLYYCNGIIRNNIISNNDGLIGGGLFNCSGIIQNNLITGNSASLGGGLYRCHGTIVNNTISKNSAENVGGGLDDCRGFIVNCIIWGNHALGEGDQLSYTSIPVESCIQDWTAGGKNNINKNPLFVDPDNGNYHLQSDSPCIDTGNILYLVCDYIVDLDGECRIAGGSSDMGAYEYGSSPDADCDLLSDAEEPTRGTHAEKSDTDQDGLIDGIEVLRGTNPTVKDIPTNLNVPGDYSTIQEALFMAFPHETITVMPGTYKENLHFHGKNIVLQSTNPGDENNTDTTVLDGMSTHPVIMLTGFEEEDCAVRGFTIRNGAGYWGGGIQGNDSLATIEHNKIMGNSSHYGGGLGGCNGAIQYNTITENKVGYGGGGLYHCNGIIHKNTISSNRAECGGGLYGCDCLIEKNIISDNLAGFGGGLYNCDARIQNNVISRNIVRFEGSYGGGLAHCNGTILNNIISNNVATANIFFYPEQSYHYGGGLHACRGDIWNNIIWGNIVSGTYCRGDALSSCKGEIRNCIIWKNSPSGVGQQIYNSSNPSYCCIQDWPTTDTGNITDDPQLVNPSGGDFHLKANSPCIDAGGYVESVSEDFEGEPRPVDFPGVEGGDGSNFDIGADEWMLKLSKHLICDHIMGRYSIPSSHFSQADANHDGVINVVDLILFILHSK